MTKKTPNPSSFRDTSGYVFTKDGDVFRQINDSYKENYDHLIKSGLYQKLVSKNLLISHKEVRKDKLSTNEFYKIIKPDKIPFISYPYEWCPSQLKAAALLTLEIQKLSLSYEMSLKDASGYNIQFIGTKPVFIDTLSFDKYKEGEPWVAYRQFCQHFLAPLLLASQKDVRINSLLRFNLDGIPLDLASELLPTRSYLSPTTLLHVHTHSAFQKMATETKTRNISNNINKRFHHWLLKSLEKRVKSIEWNPGKTVWGNYYKHTNYTNSGTKHKHKIVGEYLKKTGARKIWDIGANTGSYSKINDRKIEFVVSIDNDTAAVEKAYRQLSSVGNSTILPLLIDITNPSPAVGWGNKERQSLFDRGAVDCVMLLALIHHLVISENIPLGEISELFKTLAKWMIIEFVPRSDSRVVRLLNSVPNRQVEYSQKKFLKIFNRHFNTVASEKIIGSDRVIYLMKSKINI